jgi:hypothetical protein
MAMARGIPIQHINEPRNKGTAETLQGAVITSPARNAAMRTPTGRAQRTRTNAMATHHTTIPASGVKPVPQGIGARINAAATPAAGQSNWFRRYDSRLAFTARGTSARAAEETPSPNGKAGGKEAQRSHGKKFATIGIKSLAFINGTKNVHNSQQAKDCAGGSEVGFHKFLR